MKKARIEKNGIFEAHIIGHVIDWLAFPFCDSKEKSVKEKFLRGLKKAHPETAKTLERAVRIYGCIETQITCENELKKLIYGGR